MLHSFLAQHSGLLFLNLSTYLSLLLYSSFRLFHFLYISPEDYNSCFTELPISDLVPFISVILHSVNKIDSLSVKFILCFSEPFHLESQMHLNSLTSTTKTLNSLRFLQGSVRSGCPLKVLFPNVDKCNSAKNFLF